MFTPYLSGEKDNNSKVTLCEFFGAHIHSSTDFLDQPWKSLQKRQLFLFILRAIN